MEMEWEFVWFRAKGPRELARGAVSRMMQMEWKFIRFRAKCRRELARFPE